MDSLDNSSPQSDDTNTPVSPEQNPTTVKENLSADPVQDLMNEEGNEILESMGGPFAIVTKNGTDEELSGALDELKDELVGELVKRENWRRPRERTLWYEEYKLFQNNMTSSTTPSRSKVFVPIISQIVQTATSKLISFINTSDTIFDCVAKESLEQPIANNVKMLLEDQLNEQKFNKKLIDLVMTMIIYGNGYLFLDWEVKKKMVWSRPQTKTTIADANGINISKTEYGPWEKKLKITKIGPRIRVIDIVDVFPAQDFADIEEMPGIMIRSFMSQKEALALFEGDNPYFGNKDKAKDSGTSDKYQESRQLRKITRGEQATFDPEQVELVECWMPYDADNDGYAEECQVVLYNRACVVRAVPNPYYNQKRPLLKGGFFNVPLEFFANSLIEAVLMLQHELNMVRRQALDSVSLAINRMWLALEGSTLEEGQLVSRPGGVVWVDNLSSVKQLDPVEIPQSSYQNAQQIINDMFSATVPQILAGNAPAMGENVGTAKVNLDQALGKFAMAAKNIEDDLIKPMLERMYEYNLQFLNSSDVIRAYYGYLFPNPDIVTPAMITTQVNFKMNALSEMVGKDTKINQQLAFFQTFQNILDPISAQTIAKQVWELLGFDANQIKITGQTQASSLVGATPAGPAALIPHPGNPVPNNQPGPTGIPPALNTAGKMLQPGAATTPSSTGLPVHNLPVIAR